MDDFIEEWFGNEKLKQYYIDQILPAYEAAIKESLGSIYKDSGTHEDMVRKMWEIRDNGFVKFLPSIDSHYWEERDRLQRKADGEEESEDE